MSKNSNVHTTLQISTNMHCNILSTLNKCIIGQCINNTDSLHYSYLVRQRSPTQLMLVFVFHYWGIIIYWYSIRVCLLAGCVDRFTKMFMHSLKIICLCSENCQR